MTQKEKLIQTLKSKPKFWFFFLYRLPSLIWWGVRIKTLDESQCEITLPFTWRTQNPFKSVYFGAQSGAAELPTGLLIMTNVGNDFSFLVTGMKATFHKKAKGEIVFQCEEGQRVNDIIHSLTESGQSTQFELTSKGYIGDLLVSTFVFEWSLKRK